jgi:16S rRNA (guanine1207-N2)-methyltransferase
MREHMTTAPDIYFKKIIPYKYCRKSLQFRVSQDLFSSFQIDIGTQFLIRTITPDGISNYRKILDLGCGYGPLGLTLKALNPESIVHMVDSDALAVEYSRQNAALNGFSGVEVYGSLDYDDITERDFDLIVSNIPAKAGEPVIAHMLQDAGRYLSPDGNVAVVVVTPLSPVVSGILTKNPDIEIIEEKVRAGHTVFRYRFKQQPKELSNNIEKDAYHRGKTAFKKDDLSYTLETAYGLPEFDQHSYHTVLLLDGLKNIASKNLSGRSTNHALIFNPGVGHSAVATWKLMKPGKITIVDRDLLALKYTCKNLLLNGFSPPRLMVEHRVGIGTAKENAHDLTAGVLREEEGTEALWLTLTQLAGGMAPNGVLLVAGSSTAITRLVTRLPALPDIAVRERNRYRGFSLLVLESSRRK